MIVKHKIGSVIGPKGAKGDPGTYTLTNEDKTDIAEIVGTENYLPNAKLKIDCYNINSSSYPTIIDYIWDGTCTVKDVNNNILATFPLVGQQIEMAVAPYTRLKVTCTATGFQTAAEQSVTVIPEGATANYPLTPSTTTYYSVKWIDGDGVTKQQVQVLPHATATYTADDPNVDGKIWIGWDKESTDVIENMTINATYIIPELPPSGIDTSLYDYVYSDSEEYTSAYTLAQFCGVLMSDTPSNYLRIGNKFLITQGLDSAVFDEAMEYILVSFKHFKLADESDWAKTSWQMNVPGKSLAHSMNSTNTNIGGWNSCGMRTYLNTTFFDKYIPKFLKTLIKSVRVWSTTGDAKTSVSVSNDKIYLHSYAEAGFGNSTDYYRAEVEDGANEITFSIFTDNASRIRYRWERPTATQYWWLRSPNVSNSTYFWCVIGSGSSYTNSASASNSILGGFSV